VYWGGRLFGRVGQGGAGRAGQGRAGREGGGPVVGSPARTTTDDLAKAIELSVKVSQRGMKLWGLI
jgi:hypothetical protein